MDKITVRSLDLENKYHSVPVRQCVLTGRNTINQDPSTNPSYLYVSGSSVSWYIYSSDPSVLLTWANGWDGVNEINYLHEINISNKSSYGFDFTGESAGKYYLYLDHDGNSTVTVGYTKKPPFYFYTDYEYDGDSYLGELNTLLHFEGSNGSTTLTNEWGSSDGYKPNTWTCYGNAQISTADFKFGSSSLLLDGSGDYIQADDIELGNVHGWTIEFWFKMSSLKNYNCLLSSAVSNFGSPYILVDSSGHLLLYASSTGLSWDIWNAITVTDQTTMTTGTWYHFCCEFDGENLTVYIDGNVEKTTTASIVATTNADSTHDNNKIRIGASYGNTHNFNGYIDELRITRGWCRYGEGVAFTAPTSAFSQDTDYHYFSINDMKMYTSYNGDYFQETNNETNRLYIGEIRHNGTSLDTSSLICYAIQGKYMSQVQDGTVNTSLNFNDYIGIFPHKEITILTNTGPDRPIALGDKNYTSSYYGYSPVIMNKNSVKLCMATTGNYLGHISTKGDAFADTAVDNGKAQVIVKRGF